MSNVSFNFRSFSSTPSLKNHALEAVSEMSEILPESSTFRWTLGVERSLLRTWAELSVSGTREGDLVVKATGSDLYRAMTEAAHKAKQIILNRRHKRADVRRKSAQRARTSA